MMKFLDDSNKIKNYVIDLAVLAIKKSKIHPVDRRFLNNHLKEILSIDAKEFVYYNLELENDLYTTRLFACLPEVWENITLDELLEISSKFTNVFSYFTLIKFTYKYLEIDIISQILQTKQIQESKFYLDQILEYLELQWNVLIKSESDLEDFEDGFIEVNYDEWIYIKQRFLIDKRIKPALTTYDEAHKYFQKVISLYRNKLS
jgi:hypothetical protein